MRLAIIAIAWGFLTAGAVAGDNALQVGLGHQVLKVDRCFTKVAGGKAILTVSPLRRIKDMFEGEFDMKVAPYFFKNDKGKLAIIVSDEAMAKVSAGSTVDITGTATTKAGKSSVVRHIIAEATPLDAQHGMLKVWLTVDERELVFQTKYWFVE
ncbi:MAG TPA: hypothetical protein VI282_20945 [Verrucomicrobiae bacterium]